MTIEELKEAKQKLESNIETLCERFVKDTQVRVGGVDVCPSGGIGGGRLVHVTVTLDI